MFVANANAKKLLIIEAIVGVLILLGGIFLFVKDSNAPSQSPTPSTTPLVSTYISSPLQISLQYPYGWQVDATFNGIPGIERYKGAEGFFEVGATNNPTPRKGVFIKKYPKPIKLDVTMYRYFQLKADPAHLKAISDSIQFL